MTLRNLTTTVVTSALLVAMVACAGADAIRGGGDPVADVQATPRPGWVEVTWRHGGAESYLVFRETVAGSGASETGFALVGTVGGEARVFRDVAVEAVATYRYAVAVEGGEVVPAVGDPVRPEPGHLLRVEFATPVPTGATFSVVSDPAGIECAAAGVGDCSAAFPSIADVTLSVEAEGASWSWDGCDSEANGACSVAMSTAQTVTVSPAPADTQPPASSYTLAVVVDPSGSGEVTNMNDLGPNPSIACTSECAYGFVAGLEIGLAAEPADAANYRFVGWSGACSGSACTVTMNGDRRVEAQFGLLPPRIETFTASPDSVEPYESATLTWAVSGGGDVSSDELTVRIDPEVGELSTRSGSVEVTPASDTTYTLTVANSSGTVRETRTVSVDERGGPAPTIEYFTVEDDEIEEGDKTWLSWSVSGPGEVTVTIEPDIGRVGDRGRQKVEPREDTVYRLKAENLHGVATAEVEVEVEDDDDDDDDDAVAIDAITTP